MTDTKTHFITDVEKLTCQGFSLKLVKPEALAINRSEFTSSARLTRIGAHPDCEFDLRDDATSRFHAQIEMDAIGHRLLDLDSKNGTYVNGFRVRDVYLTNGATIQIGGAIIEFRLEEKSVDIELSKGNRFGNMLGQSTGMREIFAMLSKVSPSDITVLIEGESGTGKELVAEAVHMHSKRSNGPFVVFDCSAVAPTVIESELFGHVKGAFTGAVSDRKGAFQQADGGTLFLDELGELPLDLQPKLLRALEQKTVRPVGGDAPQPFNARIIAATNRDLAAQVSDGRFRSDLYYRLAVMKIVLPALRDRQDDIPMLVDHFLSLVSQDSGQHVQVGYETIRKLQRHSWPGNIRELKNFVDRAAILATNDRLETKYLLPPSTNKQHEGEGSKDNASEQAMNAIASGLPFKDAKARLITHFERAYWEALLAEHKGNVSAAARQAGIHRKSAEYLLRKLDLSNDNSETP